MQKIVVPRLGMSCPGGLVAEWYVPDGASVEAGQPLFRLEAEFAAIDVEAECEGIVRHRVPAGVPQFSGDVVGVILAPGERMPSEEEFEAMSPRRAQGEPARAGKGPSGGREEGKVRPLPPYEPPREPLALRPRRRAEPEPPREGGLWEAMTGGARPGFGWDEPRPLAPGETPEAGAGRFRERRAQPSPGGGEPPPDAGDGAESPSAELEAAPPAAPGRGGMTAEAAGSSPGRAGPARGAVEPEPAEGLAAARSRGREEEPPTWSPVGEAAPSLAGQAAPGGPRLRAAAEEREGQAGPAAREEPVAAPGFGGNEPGVPRSLTGVGARHAVRATVALDDAHRLVRALRRQGVRSASVEALAAWAIVRAFAAEGAPQAAVAVHWLADGSWSAYEGSTAQPLADVAAALEGRSSEAPPARDAVIVATRGTTIEEVWPGGEFGDVPVLALGAERWEPLRARAGEVGWRFVATVTLSLPEGAPLAQAALLLRQVARSLERPFELLVA